MAGEIVGPHGCGKSTLLESLKNLLPMHGLQVTLQSEATSKENFHTSKEAMAKLQSGDLLIIDGAEQLTAQQQKLLFEETSDRELGLLVTCHESIGLPTLLTLKPNAARFLELVRQLLQGHETRISDEEINSAYQKYEPNLREALFSLYDVYEIRRRKSL